MGKYSKTLEGGLGILVPFIDSIKYTQTLKEVALGIPYNTAITSDNVTIKIDGVLYYKIVDPYKASYGIEDPQFAVTQLAQTAMRYIMYFIRSRSEIGMLSLDKTLSERALLNTRITETVNQAAREWGIKCLRYTSLIILGILMLTIGIAKKITNR
jgi:regulator of protease activity HflC (stomatin/prohibitin superfamily)